MLIVTQTKPPLTSLYTYLNNPAVGDDKWENRGKDETCVVICDKEIKLTEELKLYLQYFSYFMGNKILNRLYAFSNLPIKEE